MKSLFWIAAAEKFAFNGIRACLVLIANQVLGGGANSALETTANVIALGFVAPILGGWFADRIASKAVALKLGAALMFFAFLLMLVPIPWVFLTSMALLALGSGFAKATIPALLHAEVDRLGASSDAAFAKLYQWFNIGTTFGVITCGILGEMLSWRVGFALGAGVCFFALVGTLKLSQDSAKIPWVRFFGLLVVALAGACTCLFVPYAFGFLLAGGAAWAIVFVSRRIREGRVVGKPTLVFGLLALFTLYFALFEQMGLSLSLFVSQHSSRTFSFVGTTFQIPATFFQIIDPCLNVLLGGFFTRFWEKRRWDATLFPFFRMSMGFLLMALAFTVASRPAWPFAMVFVLLVLSEQFVVPIVMSAIGRISSAEDRGSMMGILFLTVAIGEWLSGRLGFHFENPEQYRLFFVQLVFVSSALAAASFFLGRRALAPKRA